MEKKTVLLATFVPKISIDWFINYLDKRFKIPKEKVFIFEILDNEFDYIVTFNLERDKKLNFNMLFNNATPVHLKSGCIFSINALNKLIEEENGLDKGNVNYERYDIDWKRYKDKLLLLTTDGSLSIHDIKKLKK